ncbi:hypothetical protein AMELA_G00242200 [Ameiurus melas]|uniref:Uncharacterized protein n=1 Tax=Ameiurus melas TaxID=219545 RepID=A0A7J5ZVN0_AMEME|nr:hypothetical protein AMELA_G00242200 [Ameiurus melas]
MCPMNDPQMFALSCVFGWGTLLVDQNTLNNALLVFEFVISWPIALLGGQWSVALEMFLEADYQDYTSSDAMCTFLAERLNTQRRRSDRGAAVCSVSEEVAVSCSSASPPAATTTHTLTVTVRDLSCLHSRSLSGTLCDRAAIATVAQRCSLLQHLDASTCLRLPCCPWHCKDLNVRPLSELVPPLQVSGSCLLSLTLEGVQADGNLPLIALLRVCPKLASLTLHINPPRSNQEENNEDVEDWDLPCLPHLCTLTLMFSLEESQLKPVLCWTSLKGVLWSLLRGSMQLHTLSLIAIPCRLDPVFRLVLDRHAEPLRRLRCVSLQRSDVTMETATRLVDSCCRLISLDVNYRAEPEEGAVNSTSHGHEAERKCIIYI